MSAASKSGQRPYAALLDNVSLLTTGGSTFQQQPTTQVEKQKQNDVIFGTSTPARAHYDGIMAGFDLSPVHSHERSLLGKSSGNKNKSTKSNRSSVASPRKSSKSYSHIKSSGYGITPIRQKAKIRKNEKKSRQRSSSSGSAPKPRGRSPKKSMECKDDVTHDDVTHDDVTRDDVTRDDVIDETMPHYEVTDDGQFVELNDEISRLKSRNDEINQENFKLTAKLNRLLSHNANNDTAEENKETQDSVVGNLQKEVLEQERLLKGYQQENEKLYSDISRLKTEMKQTKSAMYEENLRLKTQVAILDEEIKNKNLVLKEKEKIEIKKPEVCGDCSRYLSEIESLKVKVGIGVEQVKQLEMECEGCRVENEEIRGEVLGLKRQLDDTAMMGKTFPKDRRVEELEASMRINEEEREKSESEVKMLREWVTRLEQQVGEEEQAKVRSVQMLRGKFNKMKIEYQERVEHLSHQLMIIKSSRREEYDVEFELKHLREENRALKMKIKDKHNGSDYHPEYFAQNQQQPTNQQNKPEIQQIQQNSEDNKKFKCEIETLKQKVYEASQQSDDMRRKFEKTMATMRDNYDITIKEQEKKSENLEKKLMEVQSRLMTSQSECAVSRTREVALQKQIGNLLSELQDTRLGTPNAPMRRIENLNQQIQLLHFKQRDRENMIKKITGNTGSNEDVETLQAVIADKNLLLAKFRTELDLILGGLEQIKTKSVLGNA
ncbi:uncharacterized protein LOC100177962 [Ciona intestinalis]